MKEKRGKKKRKECQEEEQKDKAGLEKASFWTRGGKRRGQGERYPSTEKRTLIQTMPKQRRDNKGFSFLTLFKPFEKTNCFKKQLIKRPTKSKKFKGSKNKYNMTISRNPKRKDTTEAEKVHLLKTKFNIAPLPNFLL